MLATRPPTSRPPKARRPSPLRQPYGIEPNGSYLFASTLDPGIHQGRGPIYRCPKPCGGSLVARFPTNGRRAHFSHVAGTGGGGPETLLHKTLKAEFYKAITRCIRRGRPFIIEVDRPLCGCPHEGKPGPFQVDLAHFFKHACIEKKFEGGIADVLLVGDRCRFLAIEVFHSSPSTAKKLASGYAIYEVKADAPLLLPSIRAGYIPVGVGTLHCPHPEFTPLTGSCAGSRCSGLTWNVFTPPQWRFGQLASVKDWT